MKWLCNTVCLVRHLFFSFLPEVTFDLSLNLFLFTDLIRVVEKSKLQMGEMVSLPSMDTMSSPMFPARRQTVGERQTDDLKRVRQTR